MNNNPSRTFLPMNTAPRDGTVIYLNWGEDGTSLGWWSAPVTPTQNPDGTWPSMEGGFPWSFIESNYGRSVVNTAVDTEYGPTGWAVYDTEKDDMLPRYIFEIGVDTIKFQSMFIEAMGNDMRAAGCQMIKDSDSDSTIKITNTRAEKSEKLNQEWKENVEYLLERCQHTIRVREGGGPESLVESLILTFMAMENKLREKP